jgi:hypothetical protein
MRAYMLYSGHDEKRWLLEGGLTAGADDQALAAATGLAEPVITKYAYLFYDVKERLQDPAWLLQDLLPHIYSMRTMEDHGRMYKYIGCCTGWAVLKQGANQVLESAPAQVFAQKSFSHRLSALAAQVMQAATAPAKDRGAAERIMQTAQEILDLYAELGSNDFIPLREAMNTLANEGPTVLSTAGMYCRR